MNSSKSCILIVDDHPTNIKVLSDLLTEYGFEVLIAKDGENALQKLQRVVPDLILLDVLMPGIDGFETCRLLKAAQATRDIPVIFMTALSDSVDKIKGLMLGAVDYVTKPLQHEEVIARVNVHLKLRSLNKQLEQQNAMLREEVRSRQLAEAALRRSEEKFSKAFRSSPGPMMILTLEEGRFLEVNQTFCQITQYEQEEIRGKTLADLELWVDAEEGDRLWQSLKTHGVVNCQEIAIYTQSKEQRILLVSAETIQIEDTSCVLAMTYDITQCKQAASDLLEKEQFLRSIYEGIGFSIFVLDVSDQGEFCHVGMNPAHEQITGLKSSEIVGKPMEALFPADIVAAWYQNYRTCLETGKTILHEENVPFQQQEYWWLTTLTPLKNEQGQFYRIVGTSLDITDRKIMEAELQRAKELADAANRAKSSFLANMSHELRTPLHAILGFTELLVLEDNLLPSQQESLEIISNSGEHLLSLIDDVLEVSRIEAGKAVVDLESVNLQILLQGLEEMLRLRAIAKQLRLVFDLAPNLPQYVQTDEGKLRQILLNLLGNAIKFTHAGQVTLRVSVMPAIPLEEGADTAAAGQQDCLLFETEDTGTGIDIAELDQLFDAFTQAEAGRKSHKGTGLGLYISRQLVRLLGGDITVESTVGQGSCFKFNVPILSPEARQASLQAQTDRRMTRLQPNQPTWRILVVEDQPENRRLMTQLLSGIGFEVQEAEEGQAAIALWKTWNPDLILMDMRTPQMNGYEATRQIKAVDQKTVIIAVTANVLEEEQSIIFAAGCDDLLYKPFKEQTLLLKLSEYLGVQYLYAD